MENGQPATKQDLAKLKDELLEADTRLKEDLLEALASRETQLKDELLAAMREAIHDAETRLLTAFYSFAETNSQHMAELDHGNTNVRHRVTSLELRVLEIEKRLNFPPPAAS